MATTLSASVGVNVVAALASILDVGQANYPCNFGPAYNFTDGTGANQAQKIFSDTRTLALSTSEDLDLAGGLSDAYGNVLTFTKVKALIIYSDPTNVNDVVVGGAASAQAFPFFGAATERVKVKPGGVFALVAPDINGYAITATTADLLKILNGGAGTSINYTIIIIGL